MPFVQKKMNKGFPHEEYPKDEIIDAVERLKSVLNTDREPVGITLLFTEEEYSDYPADEPTSKLPYCVMVKNAAIKRRGVKSTLKHHNCDGATTALALEPSNEKIESGEEYFSYKLYSSVATARRHRASIKSLHREPVSTYGVASIPLVDCTKTPDVVIMIVNAYQAMRIVQGYTYQTGKKPAIDMGAMQAMCSEVTVSPYMTGELNVSVMCPSTRTLCKWSENDMCVGIPYELFTQIVNGVEATVLDY